MFLLFVTTISHIYSFISSHLISSYSTVSCIAGNIEIFPDKDAKFPTMSETFPPDNTATTTHQNLNTTFVSESHSNYRWPVTDAYPAMTHSDQVKSKFRPGRKLTKPDYLLNRPDPILGILPQEKEKTHDISLLASEAHSQFVWPSRSVDRNGVTGKYEFINSPAAVCTQAETDGWEIVQKEDAMPTSNHYSTFNEHNQSIHPQVNDSFSTLHDVSPTKSKPNRYSYNSNVGTTKAPLHPISYAFGSTTPTRKSAVHETSVAPIYAPSAPVTKPVLKASTPIQKHSSGRSPVSVSKRFDPILMNQRYPSVGDNKSKWVSETSRSYSLKAVAPRKRF